MSDLFAGFLLGIGASLIATILFNFTKNTIYARIKHRRFLGNYSHPKGTVEIKHLKGDYFQAAGKENNGVQWLSNLRYLNNSVFVGVYDWKPESGLDDWGEHHLHIMPNRNISVIWMNKSIDPEKKGRLIWEKQKKVPKKRHS